MLSSNLGKKEEVSYLQKKVDFIGVGWWRVH
jgi:hypothetical protein